MIWRWAIALGAAAVLMAGGSARSRAAAQPSLVAIVGDLRPSLVSKVYAVDVRTRMAASLDGLEDTRDVALSPDRSSLAFVGSREGYDAVYVARADGSDVRRLTPELTTGGFFGGTCVGTVADPVWSPDGSRIAFQLSFSMACNWPQPTPPGVRRPASVEYTSSAPNTLVLVNVDGSGPRILGVDGYLPRWSPDGSHLAVVERQRGQFGPVPGTTSAVVSLAEGVPHSLGAGTAPLWSPDSGSVALPTGHGFVKVFGADGRLIRPVRGRAAGWTQCGLEVDHAGDVAVSPDLRRAALGERRGVVVRTCGGGSRLLVRGRYQPVSFGPYGSRLLVRSCRSKSCTLAVAGKGGVLSLRAGSAPAWSPGGDRLAFLVAGGAVAVANAKTGVTTSVAVPGADQLVSAPAWTDDVTVVYRSVAAAPEENLYTLARDGGTVRLLAHDVDPRGAAWSPDGRTLAYSAPTGLRLVAAATGRRRLLARGGTMLPSWSPDGSRVAFVTHTGVVVAELRTSEQRVVGRSSGIGGVSWSPDGSWLAYTGQGLWLVRPDGSDAHVFAPSAFEFASYGLTFTWSPDGRSLYYQGSDGTWVAPSDGSSSPRPLPAATGLVVSPEGTRIAYLQQQQQLWVADASGGGAKRLDQGPFDALLSWAPAGILAIRSGRLVLVDPDGSGEAALTGAGTLVRWAGWQP